MIYAKTGRVMRMGFVCSYPMTPDELEVEFQAYIKVKNPEPTGQKYIIQQKQLDWKNKSENLLQNGKHTVFIVHGWIEKITSVKYLNKLKRAFIKYKDYNVVMVDWHKGNTLPYAQALANVRTVGAMLGRAILNWNIAKKTLVTGFSLGAHVAGEAGRYTQEHGKVMINECHGLEPSGPNFDGCQDLGITLNRNDCKVVQVGIIE